jgi:putative DNA primase/helicase
MWHRSADDHAPKTLMRAGVRRMLNADGEPIKTNSQHGAEFGDRMPAALGEGVSFEYFILAEDLQDRSVPRLRPCSRVPRAVGAWVLGPDKGRSFDCKQRLPGIGNARCYRIPPAISGLDL